MKTCNIDGSKVVFNIDGKTTHFTTDAGSEIVYFMMYYWTHEEIIEALSISESTSKLLKHLPGYKPNLIESKEHICPTCQRPL